MKTFQSIPSWQRFRTDIQGQSIGFVPTMGALHAGHASVVKKSINNNDITVVSIFVNPTQFDQEADLKAYPSQLESDLALLESLGVDYVLHPGYEELYPDEFRYRISENDFSKMLCGAHREGHFDGVLTVVMRLLNIVNPARAYFGEKDFQQLELIRGMVEAFFMPVEIVACPTIRETDGLALSSRNSLLDPEERKLAASLYRSLQSSQDAGAAARRLRESGFDVDYVQDLRGHRLAAASIGDVRLIDNIPVGEQHEN